ncbi:hypothetical protein B0T19DRAFT_443189 [Cercophora scortea]|uniref:Uncharacterized protein n=1 Tax=Cercophora scortea TaxID=314031 RepID=A0AAE0IFD2_9PEZI|nr:hypothetical protein B0T19DRAFT_443189 [Cercophora scortea]
MIDAHRIPSSRGSELRMLERCDSRWPGWDWPPTPRQMLPRLWIAGLDSAPVCLASPVSDELRTTYEPSLTRKLAPERSGVLFGFAALPCAPALLVRDMEKRVGGGSLLA